MSEPYSLALIGTGFILGIRHGIDWDHIGAIADITASQESRKRSIYMGLMYAFGHTSVVIILGILAIWLGAQLPIWVDGIMEKVVGVTLITLGIWIIYSLIINRGKLSITSRWIILVRLFAYIARRIKYLFVNGRHVNTSVKRSYGASTSGLIGVVHGIGAETGSQVLLLAAVARATTSLTATLVLSSFVFGMLITNSLMIFGLAMGWARTTPHKSINILIGLLFSCFSLTVGFILFFGLSDILPVLFL